MKKFILHKSEDDLKKMFYFSITISLISILIGSTLIFMPDLSIKIISYICGIIFALNGINAIFKFIKREGAKLYAYNLLFGIILLILGLLIIIVPYSISAFLTVAFGLYLITIGVNKITYGVWFKIADDSSWLLTFIIGILLIIFGILMIVNPFANLVMAQLIGTFIVLSSLLDLIDTIMLKRRAQEMIKMFW